jgi:hypothetical protein
LGSEAGSGELRRRVAEQSTPRALAQRRRSGWLLVTLWSVAALLRLVDRQRGWGPIPPLIVVAVSAFGLLRVLRERPRGPAEVADEEVAAALRRARACTKCGERVLAFESRCVGCGSLQEGFRLDARTLNWLAPLLIIALIVVMVLLTEVPTVPK